MKTRVGDPKQMLNGEIFKLSHTRANISNPLVCHAFDPRDVEREEERRATSGLWHGRRKLSDAFVRNLIAVRDVKMTKILETWR